MANQVFANGLEISCKSAGGKSIACTPDVCFTPGPPPPGVPIPYPNTAMSSDTTQGSKSVKITGKETMLRNKSCFKTSTGDEAGSAPKKGTVTSKIKGKTYFNAWSMDVKIEGENAVRHTDIMTHNHGSFPGNTPTWPYLDEAALSKGGDCEEEAKNEKEKCKDYAPHKPDGPDVCETALTIKTKPSGKLGNPEVDQLAAETAANDCMAARRCALQPYSSAKGKCCHPQTGHHLIEASALHDTGRGGKGSTTLAGISKYSENLAPCICAEGPNQNCGTHGLMHSYQSAAAADCDMGTLALSAGDPIAHKVTTYGDAKASSMTAMKKVFPDSKCDPKCTEAQLDNYHKQCGIDNDTPIKAVETGNADVSAADAAVAKNAKNVEAIRNTAKATSSRGSR